MIELEKEKERKRERKGERDREKRMYWIGRYDWKKMLPVLKSLYKFCSNSNSAAEFSLSFFSSSLVAILLLKITGDVHNPLCVCVYVCLCVFYHRISFLLLSFVLGITQTVANICSSRETRGCFSLLYLLLPKYKQAMWICTKFRMTGDTIEPSVHNLQLVSSWNVILQVVGKWK